MNNSDYIVSLALLTAPHIGVINSTPQTTTLLQTSARINFVFPLPLNLKYIVEK